MKKEYFWCGCENTTNPKMVWESANTRDHRITYHDKYSEYGDFKTMGMTAREICYKQKAFRDIEFKQLDTK